MRKCFVLCCVVLLCSLLVGPASFAADRGESLRSRPGADDVRDLRAGLMLWRSHSQLQRQIARLLVGLPFAVPSVPLEQRDDGPIRGGLGLSDDPDPTGSRGEDDDEQGGGLDGDQEPQTDEESRITQLGMA